jgi:tellurite resistance protein
MSADDGAAAVLLDLEEEPDVNDWVEIFWGCFLVAIGLHRLFHPGELLDESAMRWIAGGVVGLGIAWIGHGLKDMMVKETRRATAALLNGEDGINPSVDYSLIRDVLLHPSEYRSFLQFAYEQAFSDGVLTEDEVQELSEIAKVLDLTDPEISRIATIAAINSALADGTVSEAEQLLIRHAATPLGLTSEQFQAIDSALEDGVIDDDERSMLMEMIGGLEKEEE